jgi:hypothetical protein
MNMIRALAIALMASLALTGCARLPFLKAKEAPAPSAPEVVAPVAAPAPPQGARTAAALDTTTAEQKAAALAPPPAPAGEREIGRVAVTLGNPAEPGFWLRGSIVTAPGPGRVVTEGGGSLAVDLIPGTGAAQLSLPAFRALNLPLTGLPMVTVLAR